MREIAAARSPSWRSTEFLLLMLASWLAMISIPLGLGQIGISWDALNHHIYLGWEADELRFERDFLAASYQAYQFPYLYWPVYKLSQSGLSGAWAGVVLASLHFLAVPATWMIARACVPGSTSFDVTMRAASVLLAFSSGLVLSMFDSTSNDVLGAIPLLWSVAFALKPLEPNAHPGAGLGAVVISGALAGASIAFKLSNGPIAILIPLLWVFSASGIALRLRNVLVGCVCLGAGFAAVYGYWGWHLWRYFGNPIYPFFDGMFSVVTSPLGGAA